MIVVLENTVVKLVTGETVEVIFNNILNVPMNQVSDPDRKSENETSNFLFQPYMTITIAAQLVFQILTTPLWNVSYSGFGVPPETHLLHVGRHVV